MSEHGRANALDVRAFKLANGQSISLTDRTVPREVRENVLHSVCTRFTTVLGPGSDGYHEDHIHLDLMQRHNNYKICQWNVWDPMPQIAPLLPAERPDEAPPREVAAKPDASEPGDFAVGCGEAGSPTDGADAEPSPARASRTVQQKSAGKTGAFESMRLSAAVYWSALPPPCSAICELNGESPWCGSSTTTTVPTFTRLYRSITSSLVIRMQPEEIDAPIYSGWLVP